MTIETVSTVAAVASRPATVHDGGTEIRVTLARPDSWPEDAAPGINIRQFVVSAANGTGRADLEVKLNRDDKRRKRQDYIGPSRYGLPMLNAGEAEALAYALLAAVEEQREIERDEEAA